MSSVTMSPCFGEFIAVTIGFTAIKSNHLFRATRPLEKQKQKRQTQKHTQNHKQTEGQTDKIKQTTSTNYKLTTSTTLLLLLFLHNTAK